MYAQHYIKLDRKRYSLPKKPYATVKQFLTFLHFIKRGTFNKMKENEELW